MSNPIVADNKPKKVTLEAGKKFMFCACGRSSDQPFCDGTHSKFEQGQVGRQGPD
jgi:CDGSH-type Zn-finger protein